MDFMCSTNQSNIITNTHSIENSTLEAISTPQKVSNRSDSSLDYVFYLSLIPYAVTLAFALPRTNVGSKKWWVSNGHRICGIMTLTLPLVLQIYQTVFLVEPYLIFYGVAVLVIFLNCIFGALLIPKRINHWDIPTIRAFVVGVTLGLSFLCLSLNYKFGHHQSFEPIGKILAVGSIIGLIYAVNDSMQHLYRYFQGPLMYNPTQLHFGFFFPEKEPHEVEEIKDPYKKVTLYDAFITCCYKQLKNYDKIISLASLTPSNTPVVFTVTMTAFFGLSNLLNLYYLKCGAEGFAYKRELFPKISEMSIYGFLLAAVANNFGTFAGTLVVKRKVCSFWGAFFNAIGLLIPMFNILVFMYRFEKQESMLSSMILTQCHA